jgi:lipoprotein LprG
LSLRKLFVLGLLVISLSLAVACENEPEPTVTATPASSPLEIAAQAAEAMLSVDSLQFNIEREGAPAYIDANQLLAFKRAEGEFALPDRMKAVVRVITAFTPVDVGMVVIGEDQYATDPITGEWGVLPPEWGQFSLVVLFDPETGLQRLLQDGILDLTLQGMEEIEGQPHYHLAGQASGERMNAMTLGFIGRGDVDLEVWIGADDFYVRRLRIVEPETKPDDPTTWELQFSNYGEPVDIEPPPISSSHSIPGHPHRATFQAVLAYWL